MKQQTKILMKWGGIGIIGIGMYLEVTNAVGVSSIITLGIILLVKGEE